MKPGFALKLSSEGIVLLHRAIRGWLVVGEAAPDDPKLGQALAYLRRTALDLDPRGLATKLILPDDQILYATVTAPGRSEAQRRAQVAAALDGRTPYALDQIVFDIAGAGPELQVAAVARETLQEAEAFAAQHGFNPVSFVAAPDPGSFDGEPFFGQTETCAKTLGKDARIARDDRPVAIVGQAVLPRVPEAAATTAEAKAPAADAARQDPGETPPALDARAAATDEPMAKDAEGAEGKTADHDADARPGTPPPSPATEVAAAEAEADAPPHPHRDGRTPAQMGDAEAPDDETAPASGAESLAGALAANMARSLTEVAGGRVVFASRRQTQPEAPARQDAATTPSAAATASAAATPDRAAAQGTAARDGHGRGKPPSRRRPPKPPRPPARRRPKARPTAATLGPEAHGAAASAAASAPVSAPLHGSAPTITPPGAPQPDVAADAAARSLEDPFVAMIARPHPHRNRRLALIALAAAAIGGLTFLVVWSILVTGNLNTGAVDTRTALVPPARQPLSGPAPPPITEPSPLPDLTLTKPVLPDLGPLAAPGESPAGAAPSPETPAAETPRPAAPEAAPRDAAPGTQPAGATPAMPSDPVTRLVPATIRVQKAPAPSRAPAASALGTITWPGFATPPGTAALPTAPVPANRQDTAFRTPIDPPAFGTRFDLGPDGLVVPTAKGARTPDGAVVYAGRPPVVPPPRPGGGPATAPAAAPEPTQPATSPPTQGQIAPQPAPQPESFPDASRLAVATSLVPPQRPADFSKIVAAALAAAQAARAASTAAATDSGAVEAQDAEPEPAAVAPRIPTRSSVAKRATVKNAISLNRLSLIGVFGAQSQRQALVRTARGKILKVKVGDRLDGGQVSAIGEHELYYVKGGRNIRLAMPKG